MISAFGVEHFDISKSKNKKHAAIAGGGAAAVGGAYVGAVNTKIGSAYMDNRALKAAEEIIPTGTKLRGKTGKTVTTSNVLTHRPSVRSDRIKQRLGIRTVETSLRNSSGRKIGAFESQVSPTKSTKVIYGKITRKADRGHGYGSALINTSITNAKGAKVPGYKFVAAHYGVGSSGKPTGDVAWRKKGVKFRKPGYLPGHIYRAAKDNPAHAKEIVRHAARSAVGLDQPKDISRLSTGAQNAMRGTPWLGKVKGAQPFLGKTKYAAGGATIAAVTMHYRGKK